MGIIQYSPSHSQSQLFEGRECILNIKSTCKVSFAFTPSMEQGDWRAPSCLVIDNLTANSILLRITQPPKSEVAPSYPCYSPEHRRLPGTQPLFECCYLDSVQFLSIFSGSCSPSTALERTSANLPTWMCPIGPLDSYLAHIGTLGGTVSVTSREMYPGSIANIKGSVTMAIQC